jgi:hypothetical protein
MASTTPPTTPPPAQPAPGAPAAKKGTSPLVWVLAGCGGLIVITILVLLAGGYFVAHKAKGYLDVAKKNPALAAAKLMVAANPDVEVVSEDDDAGTLTIRNKKTGEEITMDAQDIKNGRLRFRNEKGEEVTFEGSGKPGKEGFKIESKKGSMSFGNAEAEPPPAWVPTYPGSKTIATSRQKTEDGFTGTFSFQTEDSAETVATHYQTELTANGFEVDRVAMGGMSNLTAKAEGGKRTVNVTVMRISDTTQVTVEYATTGGTSK